MAVLNRANLLVDGSGETGLHRPYDLAGGWAMAEPGPIHSSVGPVRPVRRVTPARQESEDRDRAQSELEPRARDPRNRGTESDPELDPESGSENDENYRRDKGTHFDGYA